MNGEKGAGQLDIIDHSLNKDNEKQSDSNNKNDIRESVRQRKTSYKYNNKIYRIKERLRIQRKHVLNFRVNDEELDIIIKIAEKTGNENISQIIREAIMVYYGLLSGAKKIALGKLEINNPVVNLNVVKAEARAEPRINVNIDLTSVLSELEELGKLVYNWYRLNRIPKAAYDTASSKIKKVAQLIKQMN